LSQDIIIIGGGIVGVSTAYALAKRGLRTTLIESGDLCDGSSYGNAGLICPCHSTPIPGPGVLWQGIRWMFNPESPFYIRPRIEFSLFDWLWKFHNHCNKTAVNAAVPHLRDLQRASLSIYEEWLKEIPDITSFKKNGGLELFLTERKFDSAAKEVRHMQGFGLKMKVLDREAVLRLEPAANPAVFGGVHYEEDAHIDPNLFVRGLAAAAAGIGVEFRLHEPVLELVRENNRITAVRSEKAVHTADQIVVAAGAWSSRLLKTAGLHLPMQPAKGYSITMRAPANGPRIPLHLAEARMAVTPLGDRLRFAGTLELSGIDTSINNRRVNAIRRGGLRYLAVDRPPEEIEVWSGLRPVAPDGMPYIGRHASVKNLVIATGHAMLGVSMGPVTGMVAADILAHQKPAFALEPFRPDRF